MKEKERLHYGFVVVAAIFLQMLFAAGIVFGASGMFIVPVTTDLGIGQGQFTLYMTVQSVAMALCVMVAPKLMAKFKYRTLNTVCAITVSVGMMLMGFANGVLLLYVGGALMGASLVFMTLLSPGVLIPRWFNQKQGTMLGITATAVAVGGMIFNPVIAALLNAAPMFGFDASWRSAYVVLGLIVLVVCLPSALFMIRDFPKDKGLRPYGEVAVGEDSASAAPALRGVNKNLALKSPSFALVSIMIIAWCLNSAILSYLPAYAATQPVGESVVGTIGSFAMAGSAIGGFVLGAINDKKGGHIGGLFAGACGIIGFVLMMLGGNSKIIMLAGAIIFGLFYAIANVQLPAMTSTLYGQKDYDAIFPKLSVYAPWAGAVSFSLWGFLYDGTGSYTVMIICGIVLCALIIVTGLLAKASANKLPQEEEIIR